MSIIAEKYEYQAKVLATLEQELATLRAKAKAYDEGEYLLSCIGADLNISLVNISESNYMQQKGYTCSKVRVCKEVDE